MVSQVQELLVILHEIHAEGMMLNKTFQVAAIIEKMAHTWKDFKHYLKHKRKEMSIEDLRLTLCNMVKVPSLRKPTTKGRTLRWRLFFDLMLKLNSFQH